LSKNPLGMMNDATPHISAEDYRALQQKSKRSKYGNVPTERKGIVFHSKAEAERYEELLLMEQGGVISWLEVQPRYPLEVNGVRIGVYIGDFQYVEDGSVIVEDVKGGASTPVYRLKKKLVKAIYGVEIREVRKGRDE
jgi:hypothetical protein